MGEKAPAQTPLPPPSSNGVTDDDEKIWILIGVKVTERWRRGLSLAARDTISQHDWRVLRSAFHSILDAADLSADQLAHVAEDVGAIPGAVDIPSGTSDPPGHA